MTSEPEHKDLAAPIRHPIPWEEPDFYRRDLLEQEMQRVFDICHGCRRCFNLCESFPRLFDLIDNAPSGELDTVPTTSFDSVVEACTLCDMCFTQKCPYVPPHAFDIDFPHLMLRARAVDQKEEKGSWVQDQLAQTDRNGRLASWVAPLANQTLKMEHTLARRALEAVTHIDHRAALPSFASQTWVKQASKTPEPTHPDAPAYGQKAVLYATCFANYNNPELGAMTQKVLAHQGVEVQTAYPQCCGMPLWEQGHISQVAERALDVARHMEPYLEQGYTVVSLVPSCTLMLKTEWPLLWPQDALIQKLAAATYDLSEYGVMLAQTYGLMPLPSYEATVTFHAACHARAQNRGLKGAELLKLVPGLQVNIIERCSGHGGTWGFMKDHFDMAMKVGHPVFKQALTQGADYVISECPLAGMHIEQGMTCQASSAQEEGKTIQRLAHPIELLARAYGFI